MVGSEMLCRDRRLAMLPLLQLGAVSLPSYGFFVAVGILASVLIRRIELQRLTYPSVVGQGWVGVGALVGAIVGSKLGMVLFVRPTELYALFLAMADWNFEGKTVVGGLIGGYIGVEVCKKIVGIRHSTGDAFAVAIPVAQALGRVGCFLHGCCWGIPTDHWPGLPLLGVLRHPTPLYESVLDLSLIHI
jgi:phosphatidylglycerol:prolipoprotein diacylglycerol transferase